MSKQRNALGKGLSALLENSETDITSNPKPVVGSSTTVGTIGAVPINQIEANPFQPRTHFEEDALKELSASIKEHGIIQPITVRKLGYDKYQLISGERRFRAAQLADLTEIPAYIRIANDQKMLEMAIVENIQRENLNPIEVAVSYRRLIDECDLTQEQLSEKLGKSRSAITNFLRLLKLPPQIQDGLTYGLLTMGHARALVGVEDQNLQKGIFEMIVEDGLSVRETEELAKNNKQEIAAEATKPKTEKPSLSFEQQKLEEDLKAHFDSKIKIKKTKTGKGSISISFKKEDDLGRIIDLMKL